MKKYTSTSGSVAVAAATATTVLQLKSVAREIEVTGFRISFDGVTASDVPVHVRVVRQTDNGDGGAGSITPKPRNIHDNAADATALKKVLTATGADVYEEFFLSPNGGVVIYDFPEEDRIRVETGKYIGIEVTAPSAGVNAIAEFVHGE